MALLDGLEAVLRENRSKGLDDLREAILSWVRKKKLSTEDFKKLRVRYINMRWPNDRTKDSSEWDRPLLKGTTNADIAFSLANLAAEDDIQADEEEHSKVSSVDDTITKSWLLLELKSLQKEQENAMHVALEQYQDKFTDRLEEIFKKVSARLEKAEHEIEALKAEHTIQAEKIARLQEKVTAFEAAHESQERQKRAQNIIVEGLPVENKTPEDTFDCVVKELLVAKLAVPVRPTEVVRIRTPARQTKFKLLVRFQNTADKITVLRSCRKLKKYPGIKIWEDMTPKQQACKRSLMPKFQALKREGKIVFFRADRLYIKERPDVPPTLVCI